MDQTGKRVVGEVLGPLNQGQTITLDCLVNGGESRNKVNLDQFCLHYNVKLLQFYFNLTELNGVLFTLVES